VTLETVRATAQVWIGSVLDFNSHARKSSSVAAPRGRGTKRRSPEEDDDADEDDGIKRRTDGRTEEESDPIFLLPLFTALVSPHSYLLGTYQPTMVFSFSHFLSSSRTGDHPLEE
jgi:hypothetical protein